MERTRQAELLTAIQDVVEEREDFKGYTREGNRALQINVKNGHTYRVTVEHVAWPGIDQGWAEHDGDTLVEGFAEIKAEQPRTVYDLPIAAWAMGEEQGA